MLRVSAIGPYLLKPRSATLMSGLGELGTLCKVSQQHRMKQSREEHTKIH